MRRKRGERGIRRGRFERREGNRTAREGAAVGGRRESEGGGELEGGGLSKLLPVGVFYSTFQSASSLQPCLVHCVLVATSFVSGFLLFSEAKPVTFSVFYFPAISSY